VDIYDGYLFYVGYMDQQGKNTLNLFKSLKNELAKEAKKSGEPEVLNLKAALMNVRLSGNMKRKVATPAQKCVGKDIKKLRVELLGPSSSFGSKKLEVRLLERHETNVRRDMKINLDEEVIKPIDNMEPNFVLKELVEFSSKTLMFSRKVGDML